MILASRKDAKTQRGRVAGVLVMRVDCDNAVVAMEREKENNQAVVSEEEGK